MNPTISRRQPIARLHPAHARTSPVLVAVAREATIDETLTAIIARTTRGVVLRVRDGYEDAHELILTRGGAVDLAAALTDAVDAMDATPDILADWERELLEGGESA